MKAIFFTLSDNTGEVSMLPAAIEVVVDEKYVVAATVPQKPPDPLYRLLKATRLPWPPVTLATTRPTATKSLAQLGAAVSSKLYLSGDIPNATFPPPKLTFQSR